MAQVFSTAQAAKLTGVSAGTVRNYVRAPMYAPLFSAGANPPAGSPRRLSDNDLALLAYIREETAQGVTHDQIAAQIAAGGLAAFTWSAPEAGPAEAQAGDVDGWGLPPKRQAEATQPAPLAIMAQTLTAELAAARQREQILWDRIVEAETRAARAEGQLEAVTRAQGRPWYKRLFG